MTLIFCTLTCLLECFLRLALSCWYFSVTLPSCKIPQNSGPRNTNTDLMVNCINCSAYTRLSYDNIYYKSVKFKLICLSGFVVLTSFNLASWAALVALVIEHLPRTQGVMGSQSHPGQLSFFCFFWLLWVYAFALFSPTCTYFTSALSCSIWLSLCESLADDSSWWLAACSLNCSTWWMGGGRDRGRERGRDGGGKVGGREGGGRSIESVLCS